jgi:hypothetical protein
VCARRTHRCVGPGKRLIVPRGRPRPALSVRQARLAAAPPELRPRGSRDRQASREETDVSQGDSGRGYADLPVDPGQSGGWTRVTRGGDQGHWAAVRPRRTLTLGGVLMKPLIWIAVPLLLVAAVMLVVGVGAPGLWIAVVAVGIALVAIGVGRSRHA